MTSIQVLGFVDPSVAAATITLKYNRHFADNPARQNAPGSPNRMTQTIFLRGPQHIEQWRNDVEQVDYPLLGEMKAMRDLLVDVTTAIQGFFGGRTPVLGKIMIQSLAAGGHVDWHADAGEYAEKHLRFHLPLLPSAITWLYSGGATIMPNPGVLMLVDHMTLNSAINLGPVPLVELLVDARKPVTQ